MVQYGELQLGGAIATGKTRLKPVLQTRAPYLQVDGHHFVIKNGRDGEGQMAC